MVVEVPDGEINDLGTVFSVTVAGGHTRKIDVAKRAVVFRRRDRPPVMVRPGEPFQEHLQPALSKDRDPPDDTTSGNDVTRGVPHEAVASAPVHAGRPKARGSIPR